ncbi:MAG: ABC transporter permease [Candidatus Binatia bacterium]|nr:MAG: ABC transporter permease [Candidatus Binatia bacterium]
MRSRGPKALGVAAGLVFLLFPFLWMTVASFTPERQLLGAEFFRPRGFVLEHYRALFAERGFGRAIRNSLIVAGTTTLFCVVLGSLCAYALARFRFRGRSLVLGFVLAATMFPQISIVSPLYLLLRALGLVDTYPGLVLPYLTFAMPLTVWLLVGFFRELPPELEEAALVDGAGRLRALAEVVFPISLPAVAATSILTFLYCWNEFLFALSFTLGPERQTVPVAVALFRGQYRVPWGQILAASVVTTLPVVALVLAFQRRIVRGLVSGALKG